MAILKTAVIGVGIHGRYHAQKYAALSVLGQAQLIGVADLDPARADTVASECDTQAYTDYHRLLDQVDAVSIAVPARLHYQVAKDCLEQGVHVLVEKPLTIEVAQAEVLVELAERSALVLQVGHQERFNPAVTALDGILTNPVFIECNRIAPFSLRGTDVSVVLDLMIHDIDLILALVDSPVMRIDASGVAVLTSNIDIANARLQFDNGCTANITASRVSAKSERRMRLFQHDAYISLDLGNRCCTVRRKGRAEIYPGVPSIDSEELVVLPHDALEREVVAFLDAVTHRTRPIVSGRVALRTLQTATEILRLLKKA